MVYLDFIKIFAIIFVLYNHRYTYLGAANWADTSVPHVILQALATLCRCAVPLFFMASGVLLLRKEESLWFLFKHRILRILIVMLLCTLIRANGDFSFANLVDVLVTKLNWYLYAYLAFLMMLPILRLIALHASPLHAKYFIVMTCLLYTMSGVFQINNQFFAIEDFSVLFNSQFGSVCWSVVFSLSGYWLNKYFDELKPYVFRFLLPASVISLALSVYYINRDFALTGGANQELLRVHFIFAPSLVLFSVLKLFCEKSGILRHRLAVRIIVGLASTVFGIFIIETHSVLINVVNDFLQRNIGSAVHPYLLAWLSILVQFLLCSAIVYVVRLIPFMKKLL